VRVVRADEMLTAFLELESAIRGCEWKTSETLNIATANPVGQHLIP